MSFNVISTGPFERKLKRLIRKYPSLSNELAVVINELQSNPSLGSPLGMNCYKIRIAISSKGKGKSGGARLITCFRIFRRTVFLMDIYDKSEQDAISIKELKYLIGMLGAD